MSLNHITLNEVIKDIKLQSQWLDVKPYILSVGESSNFGKRETIKFLKKYSFSLYPCCKT